MLRQIRELSWLALALVSCTKEPGSITLEKSAPKVAAPPTEQTYELTFTSTSTWTAGQTSTAAITVAAKSGFHVNPEYPVSFKPDGSASVKFAGDRVALTAGAKTPCAEKAEDSCKVEFPLAATPEKAGPAKLAGIISFSVCGADKCLIEKVPVALAVAVE